MEPSDAPMSAVAMRKAQQADSGRAQETLQIDDDRSSDVLQSSPIDDDEETISHADSDVEPDYDQTSQEVDHSPPSPKVVQGEILSPKDTSAAREALSLNQGQYITIIGSYEIEVLSGVVVISGVTLRSGPEKQRILATSVNYYPVLYCPSGAADIALGSSTDNGFNHLQLMSPYFSSLSNDLSALPVSGPRTFIVIKLSNLDAISGANGSLTINAKLVRKTSISRFHPCQVPNSWLSEINKINRVPVHNNRRFVQICGRHDGTAAFTTLLINNLVIPRSKSGEPQAVGLIDLTFKTSLYGPPGQISLAVLTKPSFNPEVMYPITTPENKIIKAHAIGVDGYLGDTEHVLACLRDLIQTYNSLQRSSSQPFGPLLIHCPTSRTGSDIEKAAEVANLLREFVLFVEVEAITIGSVSQHLDDLKRLLPTRSVENSSDVGPSVRNSTHLYSMQLISYFHASLASSGSIQWDNKPLHDHTTYIVSWDPSHQDFAGVFVFSEVPDMYPRMLTTLLAGSLIQIIVVYTDRETELTKRKVLRGEGDDMPYFSNNERALSDPFDPMASQCVGIAFVKQIDVEKKQLRIVTPIAASVLASLPPNRTVLAFGAFETPNWVHEERKYWREQVRKARLLEIANGHDIDEEAKPLKQLEREFGDWVPKRADIKGKKTYGDVMAAVEDERVKQIMATMAPKRFQV